LVGTPPMVAFGFCGLAGTPPMVLVVGCGKTGGGTVGSVVGKFCTDEGASSGDATGGGCVVVVDGATAVPGVTTELPGGAVDSVLGEPTGGGVSAGIVLVLVGPDGGIGSADDGAATPPDGPSVDGPSVDGPSVVGPDGPTVDGAGTTGCGVTAIDCAEATPAQAATARPMAMTMAMKILMFPLHSCP
jgi:hypothetical protein